MAKKTIVDIALIIPDASPVLTLARVDRLDLLMVFNVPIKIVDQVHYEITKPQNDTLGRVAAFVQRYGNHIEIVETVVGVGFKTLRARNPDTPSSNLGEEAVSEYARRLAKTSGPSFVPLVLFEDPDVLTLPVATLANVHLLNTVGWLDALHAQKIIPDAKQVIDQINAQRRTPMRPFDRPARTKKLRSTYLKKTRNDAN
jgi:predicted nucleic acid-binding protein